MTRSERCSVRATVTHAGRHVITCLSCSSSRISAGTERHTWPMCWTEGASAHSLRGRSISTPVSTSGYLWLFSAKWLLRMFKKTFLSLNLRPTDTTFYFYLRHHAFVLVDLSLSRISQTAVDKFWWNFGGMWSLGRMKSNRRLDFGGDRHQDADFQKQFHHCGTRAVVQFLLITPQKLSTNLTKWNLCMGWNVSLTTNCLNLVQISIQEFNRIYIIAG